MTDQHYSSIETCCARFRCGVRFLCRRERKTLGNMFTAEQMFAAEPSVTLKQLHRAIPTPAKYNHTFLC